MARKKKVRLNLYITEELVDFAKDWSYVTDVPISSMLEKYLEEKKELVPQISPFQWLSDPVINPDFLKEDEFINDMETYINNSEEEEFCRENPDHPRAKIREKLKSEYIILINKERDLQKKREKEVIQRWMEVFTM